MWALHGGDVSVAHAEALVWRTKTTTVTYLHTRVDENDGIVHSAMCKQPESLLYSPLWRLPHSDATTHRVQYETSCIHRL